MKNIWLRERELTPKRPKHEIQYRPISAPAEDTDKMPSILPKRPNSNNNRNSNHTTSPLRNIFPSWKDGYNGPHKPNQVPLLNKRSLKKSKNLLKKVETSDVRYQGVPGSPGGHIARAITQSLKNTKGNYYSPNDSSNRRTVFLRLESKPFQFTEDTNQMIAFGHFDVNARPKWEERFQDYPKEIAAIELQKRMKKRAQEKVLASSDSAILVIMRDILEMYTTKFQLPNSQSAKFHSPDNLNLDETHVWLRLRIALSKAGEGITHRQLETLASLCKQYRAAWALPNSAISPTKQMRVKIPSILIHFMRYLNLILGGSSSFRSAQFILLRDLNYLLKLIQNIDPLKLPLDNLRHATTFRMKDLKRLSLRQPPTQATCTEISVDNSSQQGESSRSSPGRSQGQGHGPGPSSAVSFPSPSSSIAMSSTKESQHKRTPTPTSSVTNLIPPTSARTTDSRQTVNSAVYLETTLDSLVQSISSWIFSFSLLAKIVLVSAERTPVHQLMAQKNSSPNNSLLALRRISRVADCKLADAIFAVDQQPSSPSPPKSPTRESSRRGSLSSLLGNPFPTSQTTPPSTTNSNRADSIHSIPSLNPLPLNEDTATLSHHSSYTDEDLEAENINRFRSEYLAPRTQPSEFGELMRGDSRTYGDLENLLLSRIESFVEFNYVEEVAGSYDTTLNQSSDEYSIHNSSEVLFHEGFYDHDSPRDETNKLGLELSIKEKRFRLNSEGELLVEENGEFVKSTKNYSLYYDMITDTELKILEESFQQQSQQQQQSSQRIPFALQLATPAATASSSSSLQQFSHRDPFSSSSTVAVPLGGGETSQLLNPLTTTIHELTAMDMLRPSRIHGDENVEMDEKKAKEELLEKHHDFIETLCRITELKSQSASNENKQIKKNKKRNGAVNLNQSQSGGFSPSHYRSIGGGIFGEL